MCHSVLAQALSESMIQPARCALARPALARAPPLTACPSAQVNPPAGSDGNITFRLSLLASLSPVCLRPIANRLRRSWTPPPSTTSPTAQWSNLQRFPMSKRWCAQIRTQQLWMHRRSASKIPFPTAAPPQENRCLWKHILPVKIKRKVSLLLDEGLLSWQDVLEVRQGDATPRPRRARSSPARGDVTRSGRQRLLGDCVHRHPRLAGAGAVVPGSSTPPSPVRWALAVSTPTSTLAARPLPPRALLRCALTLPSRSLRHAADRLQLLPAPRGARAFPRARAPRRIAPRRIAPPGTPSRATLPSLPAAPPRPRALVHTLPPPAYACRRPVPSPRQWERLMLNPARLYPTARLQIVRDLFFREWQARAHRSHPRPTGAAAAASAADVKSTSGMRRTPRPAPRTQCVPPFQRVTTRAPAEPLAPPQPRAVPAVLPRRAGGGARGDGRQGEDALRLRGGAQSAGTRLDHCAHALSHPWQAKTTARAQRTAQLRPHHSQTHITSPSPSLPAQPLPARPPPPPSRTPTMPSRPHPPPPPLGCSLTLAVESQPQHTSAAPHTSAARREAAADPPQPRHAHPLRRLPDPSSTPPDPRTHRRETSTFPATRLRFASCDADPPTPRHAFGHSRQPRYAATAPPPTRTAAPPPPPPSSPPLPLASPPPSPHHAATAPSPS